MKVDEISREEQAPEVEDLIPEVREIERRRRMRLAVVLALLLAIVLMVALLAAIGGRGSSPPLPHGMLGPASSESLATANEPGGLTTFPNFDLQGLTCPAKGQCVAVGDREVGTEVQAAVVEQRGDTWGRPILVGPSPSATTTGLRLISCATSSSCIASTGDAETAFLVSESHGRWSGNHVLSLNPRWEDPLATACSSDGQCWLIVVEGGMRVDGGIGTTYAVGERDGRWLAPFRLGGPDFQPVSHRNSGVLGASISCASASSCTVVGVQRLRGDPASFAQTETDGRWGRAVPAFKAITGSSSPLRLTWVAEQPFACTSSTSCLLASGRWPIIDVDQEMAGRWLKRVSTVGHAGPYVDATFALACSSDALCMASGYSTNPGNRRLVAFAQADVNGHWLGPQLLRGLGPSIPTIDGDQCPTSTTCDVVGIFATTRAPAAFEDPATTDDSRRVLSFEATYAGSGWHYWIVSLSPRDNTMVDGIACTASGCWVIGNKFGRGSSAESCTVVTTGTSCTPRALGAFVYKFAPPSR